MDLKHKPGCEPVALLRGVALFKAMGQEDLEELACRVRKQSFAKEQAIFRAGDPGDRLFVIVGGRVRIEIPSEDGPPVVLNVLEPGEFFGELALCDGKPRSASAVAMEPAETLSLSRADFEEFLGRTPCAAMHIIVVLCERLRQTSDHLTEGIFYDTASRLARRLLQLAEAEAAQRPRTDGPSAPAPGAQSRSVAIRQALSPDELAEMVGTTSERIRQELDNLEQDRIIARHGDQITILSLPLLRERIQRKATVGPGSVTIPTWLLE